MATAVPSREHPPAILHDIDWQTYTRLLRVFGGTRRLRLTYDRGTLPGVRDKMAAATT